MKTKEYRFFVKVSADTCLPNVRKPCVLIFGDSEGLRLVVYKSLEYQLS